MSHDHEKIVEGSEIATWVDAVCYAGQPPVQTQPLEPVVRVDIQYWDQDLIRRISSGVSFPSRTTTSPETPSSKHFPDHPAADGRPVAK
jgi:hypothetical protein